MSHPSRSRALVYLVAPLAVPIIYGLAGLSEFLDELDGSADFRTVLAFGVVQALFTFGGYVLELVLGPSLEAWFELHQWESYGAFALAGGLLGFLPCAFLMGWTVSPVAWRLEPIAIAVAAGVGATLTFRALRGPKRTTQLSSA